ncbi:Microtubule binding protein EB1 [Giardia muris]|uniref:Microtubule binding protein EB1 n=1 Tax=Giardia muris TaxID=5742 RepID=A0A4Z1SMQ3_GIAMU|nr:Microtubule binding protein EB1 [Giardia muris]|eukprot:TNJ26982.1 Microtubule binding protein EB1 [Giardia muris]
MPPLSRAPGNVSNCYFVGRQELLKWLSDFLKEPVKRVEDCASGHHYCQILDAIYPGQVNMQRVRFNAALEWEREENFKIVQDVLSRNQVDRWIEVNKLITGKYMDNLEFLQWFKWFFDQTYKGDGYNAAEAKERVIRRKGTTGKPTKTPAVTTGSATATATTDVKAQELEEMKRQIERGRLESQFYFDKLHRIEMYMDELNELMPQLEVVEPEDSPFNIRVVVKNIEDVLYAEYKPTDRPSD